MMREPRIITSLGGYPRMTGVAGLAGLAAGIAAVVLSSATSTPQAPALSVATAPAVQAMLDAGGNVDLPDRVEGIDRPLVLRGNGLDVRGRRSELARASGYVGPILYVGPLAPDGAHDAAHRPPAPLDDPNDRRWGFDTRRDSSLGITSHPLQYGYTPYNSPPDYWSTTDPLTVDVLVERRAAQGFVGVCGISDEWGRAAPWQVLQTPDGWAMMVNPNRDELGNGRWLSVHAGESPGVYRLTFQFDPKSGNGEAWVNRKSVAADWTSKGDGAYPVGEGLRRHDGLRPFRIGATGPTLDAGQVSDIAVHGLRVARGLVYQWGVPDQAFIHNDRPVRDRWQFFYDGEDVVPRSLGYVPFDSPTDGSPWLPITAPGGRAVALFVASSYGVAAGGVRVSGVVAHGAVQPAVLLGSFLDVRLDDVTADGMQGIATVPGGNVYPLTLTDCNVSGVDAPLVLSGVIGSARNLSVAVAGYDAVRLDRSAFVIDNMFIARHDRHTETSVRHWAGTDGGYLTIRDSLIDNEEDGGRLKRALVEVRAGWMFGTFLRMEGVNAGLVPDGVPFLRLTSSKRDASAGANVVQASGLTAHGGVPVGLAVDGPPAWSGAVDMALARPGAVVGDASRISVARPPSRERADGQ